MNEIFYFFDKSIAKKGGVQEKKLTFLEISVENGYPMKNLFINLSLSIKLSSCLLSFQPGIAGT